mmetsp:Transcript_107547/g.195632  ORF Transcript_107547/g.195632 Transcript_107547/m.195632 type:complete len:356 (+) Transcript_107547:73-1140(+)
MKVAGVSSATHNQHTVRANNDGHGAAMILCGIPYTMGKEEIMQVFHEKGIVSGCLEVRMPMNKNPKYRNQNLGYVCVDFRSSIDAYDFFFIFNGFVFVGAEKPCSIHNSHANVNHKKKKEHVGVPNEYKSRDIVQVLPETVKVVVKNTFLDVDENPVMQIRRRSASVPHSMRVNTGVNGCRNSAGLMTVSNWVGGSASLHIAQPKKYGNNTDKRGNRCSQNNLTLIETLMLRGLPKTWGKTRLMNELDTAGYSGSYNFIYFPANSNSDTLESSGYAFVNLVEVLPTLFCEKLKALRSKFIVLPARVQGLQANYDSFRNKGVRFIHKHIEFAPHVKYDHGFSVVDHSRKLFPDIHA